MATVERRLRRRWEPLINRGAKSLDKTGLMFWFMMQIAVLLRFATGWPVERLADAQGN
ncbi:MAG: hypothetical protein WBP53_11900 [Dokdonella sp.]